MPLAFPSEIYLQISAKVHEQFQHHPLMEEWVLAWNGVANRFMIAVEARDQFAHLLREQETHRLRYLQERELFLFYCAAISYVESLCYAIMALLNIIDPTLAHFHNERTKRNIRSELLMEILQKRFADKPLTHSLKVFLESGDYEDLKDKRRVLFHRQMPGRIVNTAKLYDEWRFNGMEVVIDENLLSEKINFLSRSLKKLLIALHELIEAPK